MVNNLLDYAIISLSIRVRNATPVTQHTMQKHRQENIWQRQEYESWIAYLQTLLIVK